MILNAVGVALKAESLLLLLPTVVSIIYREHCCFAFIITAAVSFLLGTAFTVFIKPRTHIIYAKDGFIIVAATWIMLSAVGSLPFVISGAIPSAVDAFFETVSGFTTTGASILTEVESLSHGILFWRSFTHWIGGMGIIVFVTAILPNVSERPIHILRAEMPGPILGKLVPRIRDTAVILYLIYIAMTILEMILLFAGGMPIFDSIVLSFGTAGTGGFGIKNDSIAGYTPYMQWVIAIFMIVFGINFNLYYLIIAKRVKEALKSSELWFYIGIVAASALIISVNIYSICDSLSVSLRTSVFQVASIISTTGYATTDFNLWPSLSKNVLLMLMFMGGCAGSTAGGIKVSRILMMFKLVGNEIRHMIHPRSVTSLKFEGKKIDRATAKSVSNYFLIYIICFFIVFLLISFEPFDFETTFTAAATCFNNVGPGFGGVGPTSNFSAYSDFSKIILSIAMLMGRLEIFPFIIAFAPSTWSKNR